MRLIQRALVIGFSLDELARVLRDRDRGGAPCRAVRILVGARLAALDRHIDDLTALRAEVTGLLAGWDARLAATPPGTRAHLLDELQQHPELDARRSHRFRNVAKFNLKGAE